MGVVQAQSDMPQFAEDIRLVIWDLDETFWDGTLSEGGARYRQDNHQLVKDLAQRGIMSAICSKNDFEGVAAYLRDRGIWDDFIFPSIDWTPKGYRIKAMLDRIGLRAQSTLFVDDNPMNLAQAAHANPGLNTSLPWSSDDLADHPQLQGKPDPQLTRLAQYKVKERKFDAAQQMGGDVRDFLRHSRMRARIDYDVENHLDRAIDLINRTNQLNFTKLRLPEDPDQARSELTALLSLNTTDAGLIHLRDAYGDYGHIGFYLTERVHNVRRIKHFCFSCRVLNMYVEHWLYAHLGRPPIRAVGDVLSNPMADDVHVDWITPTVGGSSQDAETRPEPQFDVIHARGGCDLASLMHYFALHGGRIIEEFNLPKEGQMLRRDHSAFLMPALTGGLNDHQQRAAALLGYKAEDFASSLVSHKSNLPLHFLSFWADADIPLYRHEASGLRIPYWLVGAQNHDLIAKNELREAVAQTDLQRARLAVLCDEFVHDGLLSSQEMTTRYTQVLDAIPASTPVVVMLANERGPLHFRDNSKPNHPHHERLNTVLRAICTGRSNVVLLNPADHIEGAEDLIDLNHFKRHVYHRLYLDAVQRLKAILPGDARRGPHG